MANCRFACGGGQFVAQRRADVLRIGTATDNDRVSDVVLQACGADAQAIATRGIPVRFIRPVSLRQMDFVVSEQRALRKRISC